MTTESKPLSHSDISGSEFTKEMLDGDPTYGINFDRVQWDNKIDCYVIVELLLCEEAQTVTPYSSHPNRYFFKNSQKFISLWELTNKIDGILYLVNYAKKGTKHEDEVLLMRVKNVSIENASHPVITENTKMTREEYSKWFRTLNNRGKK